VWSEKGTVRGVLKPVLDHYAVGFNPVHGFNSATEVYRSAQDDDGRELIALYVGDFDPSGMYMSEADLPKRLEGYGGDHITIKRIALTREHVRRLPSFPATERACVQQEINELIEPVAWRRCEIINKAEQESLRTVLDSWKGAS
jgi:hypothetical protein